jgi:internalin A
MNQQQAIERIKKCLATKATNLDLNGFFNKEKLTDADFAEGSELRHWLGLCTHLQLLDLRHNQLSEIKGLERLTGLKVLDLSGNQLSEIKGLETLTGLTELYLHNTQLSEIKGLERLTGLKVLDLSGNQLSEIKGLETLTGLTELYLHNTQLSEIKGLATLAGLTKLWLNNNQLSEIKGLETLAGLTKLWLHNNQLREIKGLERLTALTVLRLYNNQLREIKGLERLTGLTELYLSGNKLREIKGLATLTSMTVLYLDNNQLSEIKGLETLTGLTELYLHENQLSEIEGLRFLLNRAPIYLRIHDNTIVEKYQLKLGESEDHYPYIKDLLLRQLATAKTAVHYPTKVLLLGNHASGKSSLVNMLTGEKASGSTDILRIVHHRFEGIKNVATLLPDAVFYDFGGQDFYHGLYRAFISEGGLQLLLFDAAQDRNGHAKDSAGNDIIHFNRHYWLGQKNHTDNTDPYIVIQTYAEKEGATDAPPIDYTAYPGYKKGFFLSLCNNFSASQKEDEAFYAAGKKYFKTYFNIELKKLRQGQDYEEPQWYIDFLVYIFNKTDKDHRATPLIDVLKQYKSGQSANEAKQSLQRTLTLLHRHGLVLYYNSDDLQNDVWLNPEALVRHIQAETFTKELLHSKKGVVPKAVFESSVLNDKKIRTLLLKQKVIFLHRPTEAETQWEYIVPNYLPLATDADPDYQLFVFGLQQPDFTIKFNDFIPFGFINQMICFYGLQPDAKRFWRNQLLFTLNREARVLIQMEFETLQIKVYLQLLPQGTTKLETIKSYLFATLMLLHWHKWDGKAVQLTDFSTFSMVNKDKGMFESLFKKAAKDKNTKHPFFFMVLEENSTLLSLNPFPTITATVLTDGENKPKHDQFVQVMIPADTFISVDATHYIAYKNLFDLQDQTMLPAYRLGNDGRIDPATGKEIAISAFAPFTNTQIRAMQKLFISYSKHDEDYKEEFRKHLVTLKEQKLVSSFNCKEIDLGADWDETIQREVDECDIMICLVSVDFLNTDYIRKYEVAKAMDLGKKLIPIPIKPCDWENSDVGRLYAPLRGKNLSLDADLFLKGTIKETTPIERAAKWVEIVKELREKVLGAG